LLRRLKSVCVMETWIQGWVQNRCSGSGGQKCWEGTKLQMNLTSNKVQAAWLTTGRSLIMQIKLGEKSPWKFPGEFRSCIYSSVFSLLHLDTHCVEFFFSLPACHLFQCSRGTFCPYGPLHWQRNQEAHDQRIESAGTITSSICVKYPFLVPV
jgi:hypothetical protein